MGDIRHARRINGWKEDEVSGLEVFLKDRKKVDIAQIRMEHFIYSESLDTDQGVVLNSVRKKYAHLYDWLALIDINVVVLLVLMVLVSGFNMVSALLIMLFEKTSTIGLLKAVGMKDAALRNLFLYHAGKTALWEQQERYRQGFLILAKTIHLIKLNPANYFVDSVR